MNFFWSYKYIAGLVDSDGNIYLDYHKNPKNGCMYPIIKLSISQKYPNILNNLKSILKVGNVRKCKTLNVWYYELIGNDSIYLIKKISKWLVLKNHQANYCLTVISNGVIPYNRNEILDARKNNSLCRFKHIEDLQKINNEWFSGFFDGDGCVMVDLPKGSAKLRVRLCITIDRRNRQAADLIASRFHGYICKSGINCRCTIDIKSTNIKNFEFLKKYTNIKRSQINKSFKYLSNFPLYRRKMVSKNNSEKIKGILSELKRTENVKLMQGSGDER